MEDDVSLNKAICEILESLENCKVDRFYDGIDAYDNIVNQYDLFIIDVNTPSLTGLELLEYIKERDINTPTIVISSNNDINTISKAYEIGCNDYLKKPFHLRELQYKIQHYKANLSKVKISTNFSYDRNTKKLFKNNNEIHITKKERLLLNLLVQNINKITTLQEIEEFVYDDTTTSSDTIRAVVSRLRKIIGKDTIVNVAGQGYELKND